MLNLDRNQLQQLPELNQLPQLQELSACGNRLAHLPDSLGELRQLILLKLANNQICSLPSTIGQCALLQEADFTRNALQVSQARAVPKW